MRVLLIEPDALAGNLYASALKKIDCEVVSVLDAQSALNALDDSCYDCVVLELDMQAHNGFEFLYEFSSQDDWKNIQIVIHSSINPDKFSNMITDWSELNVAEYLYKPTSNLRDLQSALNNIKVIGENNGV